MFSQQSLGIKKKVYREGRAARGMKEGLLRLAEVMEGGKATQGNGLHHHGSPNFLEF